MAEKIKAKHFEEHPDYQYQPRKPAEKKRRMTRRKAAALAKISPGSQPVLSSSANEMPESIFDVAMDTSLDIDVVSPNILPALDRTETGNVVVYFGNPDLDSKTLEDMLEEYNANLPQAANQFTQQLVDVSIPVIFNEPAEEAQNDKNFYCNAVDWDDLGGNNDTTAADINALFAGIQTTEELWAALSIQDQTASFDDDNAFKFDTEISRMSLND